MFLIQETDEFREWIDELKDQKAQVRIAARLRAIAAGNLGDWGPIAGPISEFRIQNSEFTMAQATVCTSRARAAF